MKKIFFILFLLFFMTACTTGQKNLVMNEKDVPANVGTSNQGDAIQRINDIKNGATPKVKPTGDSEAPKAPEKPVPISKSINSSNIINEATKNMNTAVINTSKGTIKVKLNPEKAPVSVENFKSYISSGFYSKTIFHRVIPGFMIQGGGFESDATQKETSAPIRIESDNGLKNNRGTIAMARTMVPDSATSQFFINLVDNDMLNYRSPDTNGYGYAVFGEVTEGMDVVDVIAKVKTGNNGSFQDWPTEDIVIESISLE